MAFAHSVVPSLAVIGMNRYMYTKLFLVVWGLEVLSNIVLLHEECHHNLHYLGVENFNTIKYLKKKQFTKS